MSTKDLKTVFWDKYQLDIALRWRTMQVEKIYICYEKGKASPDALQIQVSSDKVTLTSNILCKEYDSQKKDGYLLGIKMHYILDRKCLVSSTAKSKLSEALTKQISFINAAKQIIQKTYSH